MPGLPVVSCAKVGSGSPSVCATSYLGIRQPRHGTAALVAEATLAWPEFEEQECRVFEHVDAFRKPEAPVNPAAFVGGRPEGTFQRKPPDDAYCDLNAINGSIRAARRAGTTHAVAATTVIATPTIA
jgi:hypothetical protein